MMHTLMCVCGDEPGRTGLIIGGVTVDVEQFWSFAKDEEFLSKRLCDYADMPMPTMKKIFQIHSTLLSSYFFQQ